MNKKLILASLLCLGALVGCGGGDKPATSTPESNNNPGTSVVVPGTEETDPDAGEVNFGTVDAPISIKDARAIIATLQETEPGKGKTKYLTENTIYTKGVVTKIEQGNFGWKATIKDGNEELGIYYGKTKAGLPDPVVGDEVVVSGLGQNYAGTYQLVSQKVGDDFVGPTFEKITGKGETTPDTPDNPNATKATMQYTGGVTTNFTGEGNEASKVGLDANLFTLTASAGDKINTYQGNVPLFPGLNKHDEIRVYEKGGKDHGINVTIVDGYVIDSVTVTFGKYNEGTPAIRVGDTTVSLTSGKYLINNQSFFIGNDGTSQVQMKTIEITYHAK